MTSSADRMRAQRQRDAEAGIVSTTERVPRDALIDLRELLRFLRENPDHKLIPAVRCPSGRMKVIR